MPQVHVLGEIQCAEDFDVCSTLRPLAQTAKKLKCVWELQTKEESWTLLQGHAQGSSSLCIASEQEPVIWSQPIDAHFSTTSLKGWPKLYLEKPTTELCHLPLMQDLQRYIFAGVIQVWHEDEYGRCELSGYGMVHVPSAPGQYTMECVTWLPKGSLKGEVYKYFLGYVPRLEHPEIVSKPGSRFDLFTRSSGRVTLNFNILVSGMQSQGVVLKED